MPGSARQICVYRLPCTRRQAAAVVAALALVGIAGCGTIRSGEAPAAAASISPVPARTVASASAVGSASAASASAVAVSPPEETATGPAASSIPTPGGSAVSRSLLTEADSGLTVQLPVGAEITVVLSPGAGASMWDQPVAQGGAVVRVSVTGGYPSRLPARAVFRAVAPGTVRLASQSDLPCFHQTPPCAAAQRVWQVTVLVP